MKRTVKIVKTFFIVFCAALFITQSHNIEAQTKINHTLSVYTTDTLQKDTIIIVRPPLMDSSLVGKSIFALIEQRGAINVGSKVFQSENIKNALFLHIEKAKDRKINGYRIRIFFDNNQSARNQSITASELFSQSFPLTPVYRSYTNPYFKVTVGDFRTKSDAIRALKQIELLFNTAFIVKEQINYPSL